MSASPSRIKYFGRGWCGHCKKFSGTWEGIRALAGTANAKTFVTDMKGFSPVGYYPSFTVGGDAKLGAEFGEIMRNYEKPVRHQPFFSPSKLTFLPHFIIWQLKDRIQEAISSSTDAGYTAALRLLSRDCADSSPDSAPCDPPVHASDFIGSSAGSNTYGYSYGYTSY